MATREECEALLTPTEGDKLPSRSAHKVRTGKHNMAKGALRPEDAAVRDLILGNILSLNPIFSVETKTVGNHRRESQTVLESEIVSQLWFVFV